MAPTHRNVLLLAFCQALLLTNAVTLISINALAGYLLAEHKLLATLPNATYVIGSAVSTLPASLFMRRAGRRRGFLTGGAFGLAGSVLAAAAMLAGSLPLLCLATFTLGVYNAFGQYYRFAAADAAEPSFKAKAISYVLAGGLVGGLVGPELTKTTIDLVQPRFTATPAPLFLHCAAGTGILALLQFPKPAEEPAT